MMGTMDMNRVHLWMGLTHPVYGPMNLATYSTCMAAAMSYAWYSAWMQMLLNGTPLAGPPPSQK